ncbi:MAG: apolipoprotein N-acyltransferase [Bacteroidia bacterium]|nr:apolipoprotein N-acyltransferase [Bacteroidia bacterium]
MKTYSLYLLSVLSGILLSLAWPHNGFAPLIFIAFVPLLRVEQHFLTKQGVSSWNVFGHSYITFLIWNVLTTYWVYYSTAFGGIMAFSLNSLFMAFFFAMFHAVRKRLGTIIGYTALICFWMSYEFLHQDWDLSWTWLILGNAFSEYFQWIQWYEFTGFMGGTVWVWLVNILVVQGLNSSTNWLPNPSLFRMKYLLAALALVLIPIGISYALFYSYSEKSNPVEVVVVQPNIDPYNEKFDGMTAQEQLIKLLKLGESQITPQTQYLVGPETALIEGIIENDIESYESIKMIRRFIKAYPQVKVVVGISSYRKYGTNEKLSNTARTSKSGDSYDAYNTASQIDSSRKIQIYHKSKLVPGVEKMPFPKLLKPLEEIAFNLGGMSGSLGVQDERTVFSNPSNVAQKIAPVVCYESIYGEYVGEYVKNGAGLIFIITNDGWWGDSPGYKQHCSYARLRAIEHRRSVARSANTGTSCFINQKGEITQATPFWKPAVIKASINQNQELTFYTKHGDYLAKASLILSLLIVLMLLGKMIKF